jgi:DNA-binding NarL/FixJ family response regulator
MTKADVTDEQLQVIGLVPTNCAQPCPDIATYLAGSRPPAYWKRQVLPPIAQGRTSPEIAVRLYVAASTVEVHHRRVMRQLDSHPIDKVTQCALRCGMASC